MVVQIIANMEKRGGKMKVYVVTDENFIDSVFVNKKAADKRVIALHSKNADVKEHSTEDRCGTCRYSHVDKLGDMQCWNYKSYYCSVLVDKDDECEEWEEII